MNLPAEIIGFASENLGTIKDYRPIGGGCINNGGKLVSENGVAFVKYNDARRFPHMFETEAHGLAALEETNTCRIPKVLGTYSGTEYSAILLEFIPTANGTSHGWHSFGRDLARMHSHSQAVFGFIEDNYMGSLIQKNGRHQRFSDFFIHERLMPQVSLANSNNMLTVDDIRSFEVLYEKFTELVPEEPPSLVHGDLWSGNALFSDEGEGVLIDPAVAYSSRHTDLAMTTLFGGFPGDFYEGYEEIYPLPGNREQLWDIMNLYPLLVHVNLFGSSYLAQTRSILRSF